MTVDEWTGEAGDCPVCGGDDTVAEHDDGTRVCCACDTVLAGDLTGTTDAQADKQTAANMEQ